MIPKTTHSRGPVHLAVFGLSIAFGAALPRLRFIFHWGRELLVPYRLSAVTTITGAQPVSGFRVDRNAFRIAPIGGYLIAVV
jgi:hypothetical protein